MEAKDICEKIMSLPDIHRDILQLKVYICNFLCVLFADFYLTVTPRFLVLDISNRRCYNTMVNAVTKKSRKSVPLREAPPRL